jgi:hypothetical protein
MQQFAAKKIQSDVKNDVVILIRERKLFSFKSSCFSFYCDALFYVIICLFTSNSHQNIIPTL